MKLSGTITTTCTCETYDPATDTSTSSEYCYGDCWDMQVEDFGQVVEPLFDGDTIDGKHPFTIEGIRLWNRTIGGDVLVKDARELVRAMSVDSDYTLRWEFDDETNSLGANLSHHDGTGWVTVSPMDADTYWEKYQ